MSTVEERQLTVLATCRSIMEDALFPMRKLKKRT